MKDEIKIPTAEDEMNQQVTFDSRLANNFFY